MTAPALTRPQPFGAMTFKAWRQRDELAVPLDIGQPADLREAIAAACASCGHKDTLFLLCEDRQIKLLRAYAIQQGKREYRGPALGYVAPLKPAELFCLPVREFDPVEPWRWSPGCDVVGIDRNTVEAR